jgi:hypothetical protein
MLELAEADDLKFGASIRFRIIFENKSQAWLADCHCRDAHQSDRTEFGSAQERIVTPESVKDGQGHMLTKLDSVERKTDQVLSGVKKLTELAGDQILTEDKWAENPLGSREASADYLLTMLAVGVKGQRAAALVYFGYGETREKCATIAKVSVETIKRDLSKARQTPYAKFFARTRQQKLEARRAMKKPDDAFARMFQLAQEDPDKLRAVTEQLIVKAQGESEGGEQWDLTDSDDNENSP